MMVKELDKKPINRYKQELGKWGEDTAMKFLEIRGFSVVSRNFRTPEGELDLVMTKGDQLVFVEVKTRKDTEFGLPEDAVTDEKIDHLMASAECFLQQNPRYGDNWRLDVISIIGTPRSSKPCIEWFENVS